MDEKLLPRRSPRFQNPTSIGGSSLALSSSVVHRDVQTHKKISLRRSPRKLNVTVTSVRISPSSSLEVHESFVLGISQQTPKRNLKHDKLADIGGETHEKRKGKRVSRKGENAAELKFVEKSKKRKLDIDKKGKNVSDDDVNFMDDVSISKSKIATPRDELIKEIRKLRMELVKVNKNQELLEEKVEAQFVDVKKYIVDLNFKFIKDIKLLLGKVDVKGNLQADHLPGEPSTIRVPVIFVDDCVVGGEDGKAGKENVHDA